MRQLRSLAFLSGCAILASCGSDGGNTAPPATGGGGNTPTPAPAPTYQTFAELSGTQTFVTTCAGADSSGNFYDGAAALGEGVKIVSDRSEPSYTVSNGTADRFAFSTTFTQADRKPGGGESYEKPKPNGHSENFSIYVLKENGVELEYVRFAQLAVDSDIGQSFRDCVLGVPTLATDIPDATVDYDGLYYIGTASVRNPESPSGFSYYDIDASVGTMRANPATGEIDFTLNLIGRPYSSSGSTTRVDFGTFTGTTTFDGTEQGFTGFPVNADNQEVGLFGGGFFGPQGATAALSLAIRDYRPDGSDLYATAVLILRPQ